MHYDISGTVLQTLTIALSPDDRLWSQTHAMAWMSDGVTMDTHTGGGMMAGLGRALGGGSFFITEYASGAAGGEIAFAPHFPGQIIAMKLAEGESIVCRRETFLCSEASVRLDVILQRTIPAGLFAGQGFVVQKVSGPGTVWLDLSGDVVEKTLAPGERLRVQAGHIGMQEPSVAIDVVLVDGLSNMLFSGTGLFMATLTGPGRVWLQTMPIASLAEAIARYLPRSNAANVGIGAAVGGAVGGMVADGAAGSVIGNLLGGLLD